MKEEFYIKQCEEAMQIDRIKDMLGKSYWAKDRSIETIEKSIENSRCYGAFLVDDHKQIGFARVITDYATFYYICDVIVDEAYRGNSIGKELVQAIVSDEALQGMKGLLLTGDAHGLYKQFGFRNLDNMCMFK